MANIVMIKKMKIVFLLFTIIMLSSVITVSGQNKVRKTTGRNASITTSIRNNAPQSKDKVFKVGNESFKMVYVEGGYCVIGRTSDQKVSPKRSSFLFIQVSDYGDSAPDPVECELSSFYIGQTVVTERLWETVMEKPYNRRSEKNYPVTPTWDECQIFIKKLNAKTGAKFRMPTEWEWEYAARGGQKSNHTNYAGSNVFDEVGWNSDMHPVGVKKPNELGIYEMSGKPTEWCQNFYLQVLLGGLNPWPGNQSDGTRTIRGGANHAICYREKSNPTSGHYAFRLLLEDEAKRSADFKANKEAKAKEEALANSDNIPSYTKGESKWSRYLDRYQMPLNFYKNGNYVYSGFDLHYYPGNNTYSASNLDCLYATEFDAVAACYIMMKHKVKRTKGLK